MNERPTFQENRFELAEFRLLSFQEDLARAPTVQDSRYMNPLITPHAAPRVSTANTSMDKP
jgi:hypothetical protein